MATGIDRLRTIRAGIPAGCSVMLSVEVIDEIIAAGDSEPVRLDLTIAQVAALFDRQPSTVRDWLRSGRLNGYKMAEREWRVPAREIELMQEREARRTRPCRRREDAAPRPGRTTDITAWRDVAAQQRRSG